MSRDIPIIFSAPMIRALLAGRKSMTRRLLYTKRKVKDGRVPGNATFRQDFLPPINFGVDEYWTLSPWHKVKPGDRLWVRESLQRFGRTAQYKADISGVPRRGVARGVVDGRAAWVWERPTVPSIHMPRWASRLTLIVTATKVEKLQAITSADAEQEGVQCDMSIRGFREHFSALWDRLHGDGAWGANPAVVALTFKVHKQNIDALKEAA